jgi:hypothetical protein
MVRVGYYMSQHDLAEFVQRFGFTSMATHLHDAAMIEDLLNHNNVPKDYHLEMISRMDDDQIKLRCMKQYLKRKDYADVIETLDDDHLKIDNLKLCGIRELPSVIASIKNDSLKEKFINRLPFGKGDIIASLKNDGSFSSICAKTFFTLPLAMDSCSINTKS